MSLDQSRTEILIGPEGIANLAKKHVVVVGLGGVGGYAAEAIARAGVGRMTIVDHEPLSPSNCNRQLLALQSTIGQPKAEVMAKRLLDINPDLQLEVANHFISQDNTHELLEGKQIDYLLDCIDSIACKAPLVAACQAEGISLISALGAGGRMDVTKAKISTLAKTQVCPLARKMRVQMRKIKASMEYPVVYSDETPIKGLPHQPIDGNFTDSPRAVNGTISYMPGLFGLMMAGLVIQELLLAE